MKTEIEFDEKTLLAKVRDASIDILQIGRAHV